ncbi:MAG: DUF58 domain-containing protein [Chloroflexi bacterium]|nr:DUF58 domain-containing protein [Chloroflexota bacterium]
MRYLLSFIVLLFLIAALFRVDSFFYLLYLLFGVFFLSRVWIGRVFQGLRFRRSYTSRAFLGERLDVTLYIKNDTFLPLPWLRAHESVPIQLRSPNFVRLVTSLLPYEEKTLRYELDCRRRGYYPLGPLLVSAGDLFGVRQQEQRFYSQDAITVYPRIVPLTKLDLPAQTPFGDIPSSQRLFEDPTRMIGVRDYQAGDSMRYIHWKATAAMGRLQVKRFEPAISIEAQIFLNLDRRDYTQNRAAIASELAIVVAASVANYLAQKRQTVGLSCNGLDPLRPDAGPLILPPRKGRDQLMSILDILARVQLQDRDQPRFSETLRRASLQLTWGGVAVVITPHADEELFDSMVLMKRAGFHVVLVLMDPRSPFVTTKQHAQQIGVRAYQIWTEADLDVWR